MENGCSRLLICSYLHMEVRASAHCTGLYLIDLVREYRCRCRCGCPSMFCAACAASITPVGDSRGGGEVLVQVQRLAGLPERSVTNSGVWWRFRTGVVRSWEIRTGWSPLLFVARML